MTDRLAHTLKKHRKPVLWVCFSLAIVGFVLYLAQDPETLRVESPVAAADERFPDYVASLVGAPVLMGDAYTVLRNGDEAFPAMLSAIDGARTRVNFETYAFKDDEIGKRFIDAMARAAERGVFVRIVLDPVGSAIGQDSEERLKTAGAHLAWFNPLGFFSLEDFNYRTHRKTLVVDGDTAFVGGMGVSDQWLGHAQDKEHWRDTMVRIEGPVVRLMEGAFNENFIETLGPVTPIVDPPEQVPAEPLDTAFVLRSSPTGGANDLKRLYLLTIGAARRTLDISTPYFLTDESSRWALAEARRRGVRVRILVEGDLTDAMPVKYASRDAYQQLMEQGIEIYEYQPTMMHVKAMVVDDTWSMVGSANFDNRSLELNDEMNMAVSDRGFAARLLQDFEQDLRSAKKLDPDTWRRRPFLDKVREHFWSYFGEIF